MQEGWQEGESSPPSSSVTIYLGGFEFLSPYSHWGVNCNEVYHVTCFSSWWMLKTPLSRCHVRSCLVRYKMTGIWVSPENLPSISPRAPAALWVCFCSSELFWHQPPWWVAAASTHFTGLLGYLSSSIYLFISTFINKENRQWMFSWMSAASRDHLWLLLSLCYSLYYSIIHYYS